jgi:PAS domain S-box-containing protein
MIHDGYSKIEAMAEMAPFGIYFNDTEGRYRIVNRSFEEISGKACAEIIGKFDDEVLPANLAAEMNNVSREMRASGAMSDKCINITGQDNAVTHYYAIAAPIKNSSGETCGSVGFLMDVTEIITKQNDYQEISQQYQILLEHSNDAICIIKDGMVQFQNSKMAELLGYNDEEIRTIPFLSHVHAEDRKIAAERYRIRITDKIELEPTVYRFIRKDGGILWGSTKLQFIKQNNHDALLCIAKDVTSQKNLEIQLNHARKMEAIGTLAGGIAHDFNNILGALIAYTEASLYILPDELQELRSNLSHILMAGQRAKELIKQIMNFSRPSTKDKRVIDIKSIVEDTFHLLRASLPSTIEITKELSGENLRINAYGEQIQQVLMNLGSNAAHAMKDKNGVFHISVSSVAYDRVQTFDDQVIQPGRYVMITAADNGCGIPAHLMNRIFKPYFTTKKSDDGTGLGLATSKEIIKNHDGAITVRSIPGKGSIFDIYIPQTTEEIHENSNESMHHVGGKERILLIDDEELLIIALSRLLTSVGYQLTIAKDSQKALKIFEENPNEFDLVITDQTMPGMTGKELAEKLLSIRPDIPVILSSGFSEQTNRDDATAAGIRGFIVKPFQFNTLCQLIRKLLDQE